VSVHFVGLDSFTRGREGSSSPRVNEKAFTRESFPNLIFCRVNDTRRDFEHTRKPSENHLLDHLLDHLLVFSKRLSVLVWLQSTHNHKTLAMMLLFRVDLHWAVSHGIWHCLSSLYGALWFMVGHGRMSGTSMIFLILLKNGWKMSACVRMRN